MRCPRAVSSSGVSSSTPGGTHWVTAPAPGVIQIQPWPTDASSSSAPDGPQLLRAPGRVVEHPRPGRVGVEGERQRVGHLLQVVGSGVRASTASILPEPPRPAVGSAQGDLARTAAGPAAPSCP